MVFLRASTPSFPSAIASKVGSLGNAQIMQLCPTLKASSMLYLFLKSVNVSFIFLVISGIYTTGGSLVQRHSLWVCNSLARILPSEFKKRYFCSFYLLALDSTFLDVNCPVSVVLWASG